MMLLVPDGGATISIASELTDMKESAKDRGPKRLDTDRAKSTCCLMLKRKMSNAMTQKLCFCCCKPTRKLQRITQGQKLVEDELHITLLLKRLRIVEGAVKESLSKNQWDKKRLDYGTIKLLEENEEPLPV